MAYGKKYSTTFYQLKTYATSGEWQINIYLEGYGGSVVQFNTVKDSIKLVRDGEFNDVIRPTTLEFSVYNETEGQFLEFSTANWGDYKVELIYDPNGTPITKYVGYNQTEIYTEPMEQTPYPSALKFTDGLAHLSYVRWSDSDNDIEETAIDANSTASVSASIASTSINGVVVNIEAESGVNDNHIVYLQTSTDDIVWVGTSYFVKGINSTTITGISANYIRLAVTTAEGAASTIKWSIKPIYTGQKALIETLRLALNKLPSPLGVRDIVNVYDDSISSGVADSMLAQIYTDSEMYKEVDKEGGIETQTVNMCDKVIEKILKPLYCQIYQSNGVWYIVRKQEYKGADLTYRDFNANVGTESTLTVASNGTLSHIRTITNANTSSTDIIMPSASAEKEIIPPTNRLKLTYHQQNLDYEEANLIDNSDFSNWTFVVYPNKTPSQWHYSNIDTSSYDALLPNFFGGYGFQFDPATYLTATTSDTTKFIFQHKTAVPTATTDIIRLSYDASVGVKRVELNYPSGAVTSMFTNWINNSITVTNEILVNIGTYYLTGDNINGYSWTTAITTASIIIKGSNNPQYGQTGAGRYIHYYNINFSVDLPTLPQTGLFAWNFQFMQTYTDVASYNTNDADYTVTLGQIHYTNLNAVYLPDEVDPATEQILYADINEDETVEEIDVIHGDGGTTISQGSFRTITGVITDLWARRGTVETLPILTILINSFRDDNGDFKDQINGTLIGEFDVYNTMRMSIGAVTKDYILDSYTYNIETNEWDTTLIETATFTTPISITDVIIPIEGRINSFVPLNSDNGTHDPPSTLRTTTTPVVNVEDGSVSTSNQTNLTNFN